MTGYTPAPADSARVGKSALGAQNYVPLQSFVTTEQAIAVAKESWCMVIAAEVTAEAKNLNGYKHDTSGIAIVFWNEVVGVDQSTLDVVDDVVFIPMQGHKESLNVGQTAAIFMWEIGK